ncbi:MAG: 50S ribosomal protein L23 [Chloroflexi bacterium]|nr:50S ribosomal protein L23 [Chloroflexota bacterium]
MQILEVIRRPVVTERSTALQQAQNKYVFEVLKEANKRQIKEAVEKGFNVKVTKVNVINIPGETRRMGRRLISTSPMKKAVVTLKKGDTIPLFESA